ncbi:Neutral endopeptidase [Pseudoclavibacter triregionum]|nr:Neutral endopeptidase [Pseudoclavibacter triregionum]
MVEPLAPNTPAARTSGIDTADLDAAVRPQDDLFRHVNGAWLARTEIPADLPAYGSFMRLREESEAAVRAILEEAQQAPEGSEARKLGDAYAAFMDTERLERLGVDPISQDIMHALVVSSIDDFLLVLGRLERLGLGGFLGAYVYPDLGEPDRYALYLEQSGLGLPDESYYREEQHAELREQYRAHIARMLELAEVPNPAPRAERILALETAIAKGHWTNVEAREADRTYNPHTWDELAARFPGIDLEGWMLELGAPQGAFDRVILREPSFADHLATLLVAERLDEWRDWLIWRIVAQHAALLTPEISAANFDFFGKTLQGTPQQRERWKRGVAHVEGMLGEAIGREYVARHYPPTAKARMEELVANLIAAYRDSISMLEWMTPATREQALAKLERFVTKIGHPERWRDYSALEIDPRDLFANARRSAMADAAYEYAKLGGPVRRDEWLMTPQTVNAYYSPGENEIVFPAAILQPPFFDADADDAANYGAIGAVIGHEIGHGFDDQGSKYDGDGRLRDWWTDADREAFADRTKALIGQYDALVPAGLEQHVNGALTIGENIGDLGGLGIAWKAYQASLGGEEPPVIDGLTGAQRFFLSWASAWRSKPRKEYAEMLLAVDPHSPAEFRCNQIVRNLDAFHETFGTTPEDGLWMAPEERVVIW